LRHGEFAVKILRWPIIGLICLLLAISAGQPGFADSKGGILMMGDSMFSSNRLSRNSVADLLENALGAEVTDHSVPGARYFYNLPISGSLGLRLTSQFVPGAWDAIVVNGGGNDLLFGCGCGSCARMLNRLISTDGKRGAIPAYVAKLRQTGARVIYVGYLRNPGTNTPIKACRAAGDELDRRLAALDALDAGMDFVPLSDLVPNGDRSFHQLDLIHPSRKGSREIALRLAARLDPILEP
jgi:acyl-CoA thioesterase I